MTGRLGALILLVLLAAGVWLTQGQAAKARHDILGVADREGGAVIPGAIVKLLSLEFDGLLADHLFLRALAFTGKMEEGVSGANPADVATAAIAAFTGRERRVSTEQRRVNARRWDWFSAQLHTVTDLDPHFLDPYFLGNANLVWSAQRYAEANRLLDKGIEARYWDWLLPFNAGFNAFYLLKDNQAGADYLMVAAARPDAPHLLATLAARLAYEENQTANAIIFLKQQLRDIRDDDATGWLLRERLEALEGTYSIEQAVAAYVRANGRTPKNIDALVTDGYLDVLPKDPYGGRFYLHEDGKVKTTSDFGKVPAG